MGHRVYVAIHARAFYPRVLICYTKAALDCALFKLSSILTFKE